LIPDFLIFTICFFQRTGEAYASQGTVKRTNLDFADRFSLQFRFQRYCSLKRFRSAKRKRETVSGSGKGNGNRKWKKESSGARKPACYYQRKREKLMWAVLAGWFAEMLFYSSKITAAARLDVRRALIFYLFRKKSVPSPLRQVWSL